MNSKQLNFFITPDDLDLIFPFFFRNQVKYVDALRDDIDSPPLNDCIVVPANKYQRIYLTSEEFAPHLNFAHSEKEKKFSLDSYKSYTLDFDPGGFYPASSRVLHRGRFYCTTSYYVSNRESVVKSASFKSWVDKVFRLFKKEFLIQYTENKSILFSENAIKWIETNNGRIDTAYLKITI